MREDLIHPFVSGNKWRKLKYNLENFRMSNRKVIVSFGGAYSNHLIALAAMGNELNIKSIGIIRGEEVNNPHIKFMSSCGMMMHFIPRHKYKLKHDEQTLSEILNDMVMHGIIENAEDAFVIPEGGMNEAGIKGCEEIMNVTGNIADFLMCACATGTTITGLSRKLNADQKLIAIPVLNALPSIRQLVETYGNARNVIFNSDFIFGGYAQSDAYLDKFCIEFTKQTGVPVEPVYTGKVFYALNDLIETDFFEEGKKVTVIHSGGVFNFEGK